MSRTRSPARSRRRCSATSVPACSRSSRRRATARRGGAHPSPAESGMMSVTGEEGGRGVRAGVSIADMTAGMYAAYGIMLALHARTRTGQGQQVDVSMLEGQLSLLQTMVCAYLADGQVPAPMGT